MTVSGGSTPIYHLKYITEGQPARFTRQYLQENCESIESALSQFVTSPDVSNLNAEITARTNADNALSTRVTALESAAPAALTLTSAALVFGGGFQTVRVWKIGRTCHASGILKLAAAIAAGGNVKVATLPAGFAPAATPGTVVLPCQMQAGWAGHVELRTNGDVYLINDNATTATAATPWFSVAGVWNLD